MKKHSLLMLLPFALIVTGCGSLNKGSIFNDKFMKKNFGDQVQKTYEYIAPEKVELNFDEGVVAEQTSERDLILVKKDGAFGYYSLSTKAYPVPLTEGITAGLAVKTASSSGYLVRVMHGNKTVDGKDLILVFDDYGNKLYEGENGTLNIYLNKIDLSEVKEKEMLRLQISINGVAKAYAYYNVDGSFKEVVSRDEYYVKNPYLQFGYSLAQYGHKEYYLRSEEFEDEYRFAVYNSKKEKYVSSFVIPEAADTYYVVGDHIIYQLLETLPQRAEKFDVSAGDDKYAVSTYAVNYLTGKSKTLKINFLFSSSTKSLYNAKGVYKYLLLEGIQNYGKDKVLSNVERDIIVDENLKEVADVTGIKFKTLAQFGKNYYVNEYGTIYDGKMKEVGLVRNLDAGKGRILRENAKYGLINHKGEYIEFPIYKAITVSAEKDFYCLESEESWKYVKINDKEQVEVIREMSKNDYTIGAKFSKFQKFTRKSDSKVLVLDVISGSEADEIAAPEGAVQQYAVNLERLVGTLYTRIEMYLKDGKYTAIRYGEKYVRSY